MLPNKKLCCFLLSEKYLYFNVWSLFLPCRGNKEPCWKSSEPILVYISHLGTISKDIERDLFLQVGYSKSQLDSFRFLLKAIMLLVPTLHSYGERGSELIPFLGFPHNPLGKFTRNFSIPHSAKLSCQPPNFFSSLSIKESLNLKKVFSVQLNWARIKKSSAFPLYFFFRIKTNILAEME